MFVRNVLNSYSAISKRISSVRKMLTNAQYAFDKSRNKEYKLIEKIPFTMVENSCKKITEIPEGANFYTYVKIGKSSDPSYQKEIITFYKDMKTLGRGRVIQRSIKANNENEKLRTYKEHLFLTNKEAKEKGVKSCDVRDISTSMKNAQGEWVKMSEEKQIVAHFRDLRRNNYSHAKKLTIQKTIFDAAENNKQKVTLTEYPMNYGFEPKSAKKVMGVEIALENESPRILGTIQSPNVDFPSKDKFLAYRFLNTDDKRIALTRHYLKEKKLADMGINVTIDPSKVASDSIAHWSTAEKEICWGNHNRFHSIANTAAHETEHAIQHKQIGQLGRGTTDYERECRKKFGLLMSYQKPQAEKYYNAHINYPNKNQHNYKEEYKNNFLEIKAREAGQKAENEYNVGRNFLLEQFKYLPDDKSLL